MVTAECAPLITTRPFPSSSLYALMVMFKSPAPESTSFSVRDVRRSFSRASLAFEMSSRRKTSLYLFQYVVSVARRRSIPMRIETVGRARQQWL